MIDFKPATIEAYRLLHDGVQELSRVEDNGIRVDVPYLENAMKKLQKRIDIREERLKKTTIFKHWRKRYGNKTNLDSHAQIAVVLFDVLKFPCRERTEKTGRAKSDEKALSAVDDPFPKEFLKLQKDKKARNTFLKGILNETRKGIIKPVFNLHSTRTYRSSSDSPNFQNLPIRNPEMGKIIRSCFIPREGNHFVEIDYSGIEVRIAACYHQDQTMIEYIHDPSKDMHRDMAAECFKCEPQFVNKKMRQCTKGNFVFAQFYGSWWKQCAEKLWEDIDIHKLDVGGVPMKEYLKSRGISKLGTVGEKSTTELGSFMHHIKEVEDGFWNQRFPEYAQWQEDWYDAYINNCGFSTLTGFSICGILSRNEVINFPVQGSAFHCLLWSLIRINKIIRKRKMKTKLVGQIHDSLVFDVPENELQELLSMAKNVMTEKLLKHYEWINVPIDVEAEVSPVNKSWYEKKEMEID